MGGTLANLSAVASNMSFERGAKVWVEDKELAWVEADVVEVRDKFFVVRTHKGKKVSLVFD